MKTFEEGAVVARVKICCMTSREEIAAAASAGAHAVGLVHDDLGGYGVLPRGRIAELAQEVPPSVSTWLLTGLTDPARLVQLITGLRVDTVQLVNPVPPPAVGGLKRELPWLRVVQAVHVTGPRALVQARLAEAAADAVLLDSKLVVDGVEHLGATGTTHDWSISARIVQACSKPVWLAGGLNPENLAEALDTVGPAGLDLCSGVRRQGRLDPVRLHAFLAGAREAVPAAG